jgi:hypothetical protein
MPNPKPLALGSYYHIYNRGTNGEDLFLERRNYRFFLERYAHYVEPVVETYAYCLMKNHFHLVIRTRTAEEQKTFHAAPADGDSPFRVLSPSRQFAHLFNAYARAINVNYERTGSLFEHPFHRILVDTEAYFWQLIAYVHRNPQHHGFVDDFREWPFSSYGAILSSRPTRVRRDVVIEGFGGRSAFVQAHESEDDELLNSDLLLE